MQSSRALINPKGNTDTERSIRTIKEYLVWTYKWESPHQFEARFINWVKQYNTDLPHMTLGYKTPKQFANNTL